METQLEIWKPQTENRSGSALNRQSAINASVITNLTTLQLFSNGQLTKQID